MSLKKIFIIALAFIWIDTVKAPLFSQAPEQKMVTIILDPCGDAQQTGRKVDDRYERSITLQCAQELKKMCSTMPHTNIIITRTSGYTRTEFDTAQLANRLQADVVFFLSAALQPDGPTSLHVYRFSYNPHFLPKPQHEYALIPYDQAYACSAELTGDYASLIKKFLDQHEYQRSFSTQGVFAIPYKPLIGIQTPAIGIEFCLHTGADWQSLLNPLAQSIMQLIKTIQQKPHE